MVSTLLMERLKKQFYIVYNQKIDISQYPPGISEDLVVDIISTESFIVGIGQKILEHVNLSKRDIDIINKPLISENHWYLNDVEKINLSLYNNSIVTYAKNIESLRKVCAEIIEKK